jgi:ATP-dependent DNA helicase RecG
MRQDNLTLDEIILLDKLQKGVKIPKADSDQLRKKKLIEGRYPNVYPAAVVAANTQKMEEYLENRAFDDAFYIANIKFHLPQKKRFPQRYQKIAERQIICGIN